MATLIFDIETIGEDWTSLDATTQEVLQRWIDRSVHDKDERVARIADLKASLGFSPLTGSIVAIGLYDLERHAGAVYYQGESSGDLIEGEYVLKVRTEKEMLEDFWEGIQSYDTVVTFNGRAFDVPFIVHRSVVHGIRTTADLMSGRYLYQQKGVKHVDLQDQLTFYGAMQRRPNLHLFCRAYGIESPKAAGMSGDDVAELFRKKQFRDIARYNARDVIATTELYQKWCTYIAQDDFNEEIQ